MRNCVDPRLADAAIAEVRPSWNVRTPCGSRARQGCRGNSCSLREKLTCGKTHARAVVMDTAAAVRFNLEYGM